MNKTRNTIRNVAKKVSYAGAMTAMAASMTLTSVSGAFAADIQNQDLTQVQQYAESDGGVTLADGTVLEEGKYNIGVSLQTFSNPDNASMAAGSLADTAVLTVADGVATIELTFSTLQLGTLYGNLTELYFFNDRAECASGEESYRQAATILSYRDDATASDMLTGAAIENQTMPEKMSFTLPYTDSSDIYIGIVVDVMAAMGMDFTEAVLRIDYDTADEIVDKTALNTAITTAKNVTSDEYTEESFAALTTAISAAEAVYDNEDATQKQVDAQITSLETATAALELKASGALEQDLANGVYEVSLQLWNASADKASMANSSINGNARIIAKDGVYTMHMYTQPMTFGSITASLQEMKVYAADGSYTDAVVEAYDEDGNPIEFSFVLPTTEEYIDVAVNPHVAMMGNMDIAARLKVDYSTLNLISTELPDDNSADNGSDVNGSQTGDQNSNGTGTEQSTDTVTDTATDSTTDTSADTAANTATDTTADSTNTSATADGTVQTADHNHMATWITLMAAGLTAALAAGITKKKQKPVQGDK